MREEAFAADSLAVAALRLYSITNDGCKRIQYCHRNSGCYRLSSQTHAAYTLTGKIGTRRIARSERL